MTQNPGYTTRTVQPIPQLDSLRVGSFDKNENGTPVSPEVARYQIELELARLTKMAEITADDLNKASLHPEVRAALEGQIDIHEPVSVDSDWIDQPEPAVESTRVSEFELTGEAATIAAIEALSDERWYQEVRLVSPQIVRRLRPDGIEHSEQVILRVQSDYELAA